MTVAHGNVQNGSVYIKDGKIAAVGKDVSAPSSATVIDAGAANTSRRASSIRTRISRWTTDVNEATSPITPQMMMIDAFDYQDKAIYRGLAGGVTTSLLLHGSANMIGGQGGGDQAQIWSQPRRDVILPARRSRSSSPAGRNPKRVYGSRDQLPSTRMGNFAVQRAALVEAQDYMREWNDYNAKAKAGDKDAKMPKHDLKLDALADVLRGKLLVQIHCYRARRTDQ